MIFKLAFRNIFRNTRRTVLTISMMVFGYIFFSMFISLSDGVYGNIINQFILERTGHVQIHHIGFLENPNLLKNISNYQNLLKDLDKKKQIVTLAPRIKSGALAFGEKKHLGVEVIGIDPDLEKKMTNINERVKIGSYFTKKRTVIVGKRVSEVLKIGIGEKIILISQGADGSVANDIFEIEGIIAAENESFDDSVVYMSISTAQDFYSLFGKIHEIAIRLNQNIAMNFSNDLNQKLDSSLIASPWQVVESDFYKAMEADKRSDSIGRMIFMLVVIIGVLNTILMSILERTQEFGVLKALGTRPIHLFKLILIETTFLSLISIFFGALLSLGINYYLSKYGIEFEPFEYGGMRFDKMLGVINFRTFYLPAITIIVSSLVVTIFPALKAARVTPVDAMRSI